MEFLLETQMLAAVILGAHFVMRTSVLASTTVESFLPSILVPRGLPPAH